jgi:hypothetical protein
MLSRAPCGKDAVKLRLRDMLFSLVAALQSKL